MKLSVLTAVFVVAMFGALAPASAQMPVKPDPDHEAMLASDDPELAANKRLVYDMWRIVLEANHIDEIDQYIAEGYTQHNPNIPTGRAPLTKFLSQQDPQEVRPKVQRPLVDIVAEDDKVVLIWVDERKTDSGETYTTTAFDMFRIENSRIVEHWDAVRRQ